MPNSMRRAHRIEPRGPKPKPLRLGPRAAAVLLLAQQGWELRESSEWPGRGTRYLAVAPSGRTVGVNEKTLISLESHRLISYQSNRTWPLTPAGLAFDTGGGDDVH